ncbi:MAG: Gfo/Idh/MocA family oxidoreductase, partial [Bacteroidia bacterium]|nr:Gfo/Idh/MocA family oxidoreductase [Bacteroidia bacterium]
MEAAKNDITFTLIGNGHIGKRHAAIIEALPDAELVIGKREARDENREGEETLEGLRQKVEEDLPEARSQKLVTVIATPNYLHCKQAIAAMENGSDVIIEKPMGLNAEECRLVIKRASELDKKVFCVMQNRYSPPSVWLKDLIGSNRLGKIFQVQVNCFWNRNESYYQGSSWKGKLEKDGGTLFTQFSHFVDTLFWLFGDIEPISAQFFNHNHPYIEFEDSGVISAVRVKNEELRIKSPINSSLLPLTSENTLTSSLLPLNSKSALHSSLLPLTSENTLTSPLLPLHSKSALNSSLLPLHSFPIQINYSTSAYAQNLESSITILAENGNVKVGGQYMDQVLVCNIKDYEMPELKPTLPPNNYGTYKGSASNHEYVY